MEAKSRIVGAWNQLLSTAIVASQPVRRHSSVKGEQSREIIDFHFSMSRAPSFSFHQTLFPSLSSFLFLSTRAYIYIYVSLFSPLSSLSFFFIQNNPTSSFLNRSCANAYNLLPRFRNPEVGAPPHTTRYLLILITVIPVPRFIDPLTLEVGSLLHFRLKQIPHLFFSRYCCCCCFFFRARHNDDRREMLPFHGKSREVEKKSFF